MKNYIWIHKWKIIHGDYPFSVHIYLDGKCEIQNHENFKTLEEAEDWAQKNSEYFGVSIQKDC
jgi:hypothetical protein